MRSSYPKIWTDIYNDEWFLGLSALQRGLWLQLIITAKMYGDSGLVSGRSRAAIGSLWGCDGKTCGKILGKFRDDGKIELVENNNGTLTIHILNYVYYQRDKQSKNIDSRSEKDKEKPRKNPPITEDKDKDKRNIPFVEIIADLNKKSGKNYHQNIKKTKDFIKARWNEGFRLSDFKYVHDVKVAEWLDNENQKYLRPETLYGNKFEGYRNQAKVSADGKPKTFDKTETCDHCHHEGAIVEDPDDVDLAKELTGKAVIFKNGLHHFQCLTCGKRFERF